MQLDKYISDIKDGIEKLNKWPSKMLTERSIEINYTDNNIRLSGRIIIAFSVPNGHVNVRVSFYNYNCVRKESIVMRELSVDAVVKQVESFVDAKKDSLIAAFVEFSNIALFLQQLEMFLRTFSIFRLRNDMQTELVQRIGNFLRAFCLVIAPIPIQHTLDNSFDLGITGGRFKEAMLLLFFRGKFANRFNILFHILSLSRFESNGQTDCFPEFRQLFT